MLSMLLDTQSHSSLAVQILTKGLVMVPFTKPMLIAAVNI